MLSKRGLCSRAEAERLIRAGRVAVRGRVILDPQTPTAETEAAISVDGVAAQAPGRRYLMLNKPRGLVTTTHDERARDTVYRCFEGDETGWLAPVGRLDKASEGLLLFTNDPAWAARITDPATGPAKRYHVQVAGLPDAEALARMQAGVVHEGERLAMHTVSVLRNGERNTWLDVVLDEGRNRQIRRILAAMDLEVLRLVRVAIGPLVLGDLGKGAWRELTASERDLLAR